MQESKASKFNKTRQIHKEKTISGKDQAVK